MTVVQVTKAGRKYFWPSEVCLSIGYELGFIRVVNRVFLKLLVISLIMLYDT